MRVLTSLATRRAILGNIIDAMESSIVVVDQDARVILVNQAFLDFGRANGMAEPEDLVGTNYLKVCVGGARTGATEAGSVGIGLQRVLSGQAPSFSTIYDCHSDLEQRWMRVTITPWSEGSISGAVFVHEDITPTFLAQRALMRLAGHGARAKHVLSFVDLQPALSALAEGLAHICGKRAIVDFDTDLDVMADIERLLTCVARLALDAAKDGPLRLEGMRQGRRIVVRVGGWRRDVDSALLDGQLAALGGRTVLEVGGTQSAPLVDLVLQRARPPVRHK